MVLESMRFWSNVFWEDVIGSREDVSHEGTVLDVLVITYDMHSVVARFSRPVSDVT